VPLHNRGVGTTAGRAAPGITARELNRATLARQLLLGREPLGVEDAVRRVVALQAQHPASPHLALWNRLTDLDPAEVGAAIAAGRLVKATLLRITLHLVHVTDYPTLHTAMRPTLRSSRLGDARFTSTGTPVADVDALVPDLLAYAYADRPRTPAELQAWLGARLDRPATGVWWALRSFAPLVHAPTGGPWSYGLRPVYRAAPVPPSSHDPEHCLQTLVRRYLTGFGPASVADVARFSLVPRARARAAVAALGDRLDRLTGPDGTELFDVPGAPRPPGDVPAPPRLMAMWDSVLLAHADRSRVVPPEYRTVVTRVNGDVLPTLLVDGYVAGVWRPVDGGIEATAFRPLPAAVWDALAVEAHALCALLADREPGVYQRYGHWWARFGGAEVRVLPGP
jgi:hypothetical protein